MMAEPEAISRGDRFSPEVARGCRGFDGSDKQRVDPFEDCFEQLPGILPVFEKAVQHESQARIELDFIDAAEQKITHHKGDHMDEGCRRRLESSETLERRVAFATQPQNLTVKMLLARKMPEQQRLGNASRLGQLLGSRAREPFSRK